MAAPIVDMSRHRTDKNPGSDILLRSYFPHILLFVSIDTWPIRRKKGQHDVALLINENK